MNDFRDKKLPPMAYHLVLYPENIMCIRNKERYLKEVFKDFERRIRDELHAAGVL